MTFGLLDGRGFLRTVARAPRGYPLFVFPFVLSIVLSHEAMAQNAPLLVFAEGRSRVYLDISAEDAHRLRIEAAVEDLADCFERMTGRPLPQSGGTVRLFGFKKGSGTVVPSTLRAVPATVPDPFLNHRFECVVRNMRDDSARSSVNAQAALVLSPTKRFAVGPFAGPGEKVAWNCTWHRGSQQLVFRLVVAKQAYYGPGYGPFTFAELRAKAPKFEAGGAVRLALEMRYPGDGSLRGGYAIDGAQWLYTEWFDPTQAATDDRVPGESDKNGRQAWRPDWPKDWAGATAFYVTAYAPKGCKATVTVDDVRVSRARKSVFSSQFEPDAEETDGAAAWVVDPRQGSVEFNNGMALLHPESDSWNTVGLRAHRPGPNSFPGQRPLQAVLMEYPEGISRFDASAVQGFEIDANEDRILLRASTPLGLQNSIYYLLQHWGCRWVMPGQGGECIPARTRLSFPQGLTRFSPYSDISVEVSSSPWRRRNLAGWQHWLTGQHYWLNAISPKEHFQEHPEWFSLLAGKRVPKQLCTTNPEVIAKMSEVAKRFLRGSSQRMSFPMDPMDNIDFCQCEACRANDPPGALIRGVRPMTDRVVRFCNAVAAGIKDEFPDRYVAFYSYATHSNLPVNTKPADNVVVIVCRSSHCLLHLTPTGRCPTSDFHDFVKRWRELTPNIYCYEYDPISWTGGLPCPTYLEMARSLKTLFTEVGIKGSYSDGSDRAARFASTYINLYMARRIKLDPTQDVDEVLTDLCQSFFGPAAVPMEQYYHKLAEVADSTHAGRSRLGGGTTFYHEIFSPQIVQAARRFLDQALASSAGKEPFRQRVAMVDMSQRYLEAYVAGVWNAQQGKYDASVSAFDRMNDLIDEMEKHGFLDGADARRRAKTMRMKALAQHFPEKLGFVSKWSLLGPFDNSTRNAHLEQESAELIASANETVTFTDGTVARWWDCESPGGFVNLEKAFAGKTGDWPLSYAYARTRYFAPRAMSVQLRMDSFFPFRVFLNGKEVYHRLGLDADCPDKRKANVRVKAGENVIIFKLSQTVISSDTFPWGLYFRVVQE